MSNVTYRSILKTCRALLREETIRDVEKDLKKQIADWEAGIRVRKGRLPKHMLSDLEHHKHQVEKGVFRYNPMKEVRSLDHIQEIHAGEFTSSDYSYMSRRRKKAQQNHIRPTPYFRVCGERRGGLITKWERAHMRLWEIIDRIDALLVKEEYGR